MQNFIFISPNFPTNYWQFCRELKNDGMNVLGIGDQPYDAVYLDEGGTVRSDDDEGNRGIIHGKSLLCSGLFHVYARLSQSICNGRGGWV